MQEPRSLLPLLVHVRLFDAIVLAGPRPMTVHLSNTAYSQSPERGANPLGLPLGQAAPPCQRPRTGGRLSRSTTHRHIAILAGLGYLQRVGGGTSRPVLDILV